MLAQNFKTAVELGITEVEQQALVTVLGMLERGEIPEKAFIMQNFRPTWWPHAESIVKECGTIGCLCGWANFVSRGEAFPDFEFPINGAIERLFAIESVHTDDTIMRVWKAATPASAAIALRSYLTTGEANWAEALMVR